MCFFMRKCESAAKLIIITIYTMKTPISYYGGKQKLASTILKLIPKHKLYCEPFIGGAAIYFAKEPSAVEVINDVNKELVNFYRMVQTEFVALETEIRITLHSRDLHRKAKVIYDNPDMFTEIKRAWAVGCYLLKALLQVWIRLGDMI